MTGRPRCRAVYVLGPPGVGKTTALDQAVVMAGWRPGREPAVVVDPRWPLLRARVLRRGGLPTGWLLGVSRARFAGTDGLSMAVHPHAVAWATQGRLPRLVAGEGQRLGTVAFLTALAARADLTVVHLTADDAALAARRAGRHNTQAPAWMRAAATRAARAAASARDRGVLVVEVDSTDSSPTLVARTLAGLMQEREAPPG